MYRAKGKLGFIKSEETPNSYFNYDNLQVNLGLVLHSLTLYLYI